MRGSVRTELDRIGCCTFVLHGLLLPKSIQQALAQLAHQPLSGGTFRQRPVAFAGGHVHCHPLSHPACSRSVGGGQSSRAAESTGQPDRVASSSQSQIVPSHPPE